MVGWCVFALFVLFWRSICFLHAPHTFNSVECVVVSVFYEILKLYFLINHLVDEMYFYVSKGKHTTA